MILITPLLNIKLLKNNNVKLEKNNVAYSDYFDKILFEIDKTSFYFLPKEKEIIFHKEDAESIFDILIGNQSNCQLTLKEYNKTFIINIIKSSYKKINNKHIINYQLESDEEDTTIEINIE